MLRLWPIITGAQFAEELGVSAGFRYLTTRRKVMGLKIPSTQRLGLGGKLGPTDIRFRANQSCAIRVSVFLICMWGLTLGWLI